MENNERTSNSTPHSCKIEGNLLEYPLFHFGDRSKPSKMTFVFEDEINGQRVCRRITVGNFEGLPGALAQDCLVALLMLREVQDGQDIHFYNREVTRLVFGSDRSMRRQQLVKNNLKLLAKTIIEFQDSFFDKETDKYITTKIRPIFEKADLYEHHKGDNRMAARDHNVFRLCDLLQQNINASYFNWVYFENYRRLKSGLPRRLFLYLTKKSNGGRRRDFVIRLEKLYPRLPITSQRPSERFEVLERAAKDLEKVGITYRYDNAGKITFFFPEKLRQVVEAPRVDGKALEDLVVRFYQGVGSPIVSDRRKREGVELLRGIQAEAGVGAERLGQIIQWVLDRRDTKFKGLHSIQVLSKAWDQALSAITREEARRTNAEVRASELEVQKAFAKNREGELAVLRTALSVEDLSRIHKEAERRFVDERKYCFARNRLETLQNEAQRDRVRGWTIKLIEDAIIRERAEASAKA